MSNAFEKTHWFTQMIIYSHFLTWLPLMIWELGHEWRVITCTFIMPLCSYTHCLYLLSYLLCQVDALRSKNTHLWPFLLQDFIMFIWTPSVLLTDWQKIKKIKHNINCAYVHFIHNLQHLLNSLLFSERKETQAWPLWSINIHTAVELNTATVDMWSIKSLHNQETNHHV